ncbi:hypothetical protein BU14_0056s0018, partial [Porphyra umbilicalis]
VVATPAARNNGAWGRFEAYCCQCGLCPLPASTETVLAYVGCLWRGASVVALSLKPILAAVRKRHLAAGQPNPCDDDRVREAKAGFRRAGLAYRPVTKLARVPLPAAVAWQLAALALRSPKVRCHQLTAVVLQFWWMRRAGDITRLTLGDVDVRADGSSAYQVPRHKTEADTGLTTRRMPAGVHPGADLPHVLLTRLVADFRAAGRPPTTRLFTTCGPDAAATLVTTWLRDGLRRLGMTPGRWYGSGGATAANAAGVNRGAIAALSATTEPTLAASCISSLVVPSVFDRFFFARMLPR